MAKSSQIRLVTGQQSWSGGTDSSKTPQIASPDNPTGLRPDQLAWLSNATCRGGGVTPRGGWRKLCAMPFGGLFQDAEMYSPLGDYPYIISSVAGRILQVRVDTDNSIIDLSGALSNPSDIPKAFMCQGEEFLVIQAGDYLTLPLIYDGMTLKRSTGYVYTALPGPSFIVPAINAPVLVTLTAPYTSADNLIFTIDGYRYQQVLRTQCYSVASAISAPSGFAAAGIANSFNIDFPSNYSFYQANLPSNTVSCITPFRLSCTQGNNVSGSGTATNAFFNSTTLVPATTYRADNVPVANITASPKMTSTPLAAPGANQVWLVNLDDPRIGTAVNQSAVYSQLPAGGPMDYYQGHFWVANGREYLAGDTVGGPSGSAPYDYRDAILYINESTFLKGGGTFSVPSQAGNITALKHNANINTALGQGVLYPFTRKTIYQTNVPANRADWIAAGALTDGAPNNLPLQTVAQINFGTTSDRSVVTQNGDLFFRSPDGIRSLITAVRYFGEWANTPISTEVSRALDLDDELLLDFTSGITFNNRLYMTCLPYQTDVGVAFRGIVSLDYDLISGLNNAANPVWEGMLQGLDILKLLKGDFGGNERAFAFCRSRITGAIELWELTKEEKEDTNDSGENRITWIVETPSYIWDGVNALKELETMRFWFDRIFGKVDFTLYFKNDQNPCWQFWHHWSTCAARDCTEDPTAELCSVPRTFRQQYRAMMAMPKPHPVCDQNSARSTNIGYSFQFRLIIKGYARLRGLFAYALPRDEQPFEGLVCAEGSPSFSPIDGQIVIPPPMLLRGPQGEQGRPGIPGPAGAGGVQVYQGAYDDPNGFVTGRAGDLYKNNTVGTEHSGELWILASDGNNTWY